MKIFIGKISSINYVSLLILLVANQVQAQVPDDSPKAREAAIARLKKLQLILHATMPLV